MGTALWPAIPTIIPPNTAVVCADVTAGTGVLGAQTDHVGVAGVAIPIVVNTIAHVAGLLGCGGCGAVELGCGDGGGDAEFGGDRGDRGGAEGEVGLAVGGEIRCDERLVVGLGFVCGVSAEEGMDVAHRGVGFVVDDLQGAPVGSYEG
jgi:hypothetical protein